MEKYEWFSGSGLLSLHKAQKPVLYLEVSKEAVGGRKTISQGCTYLLPRTFKYVTMYGERNFADEVKVTVLELDYPVGSV